MGVKEILIMEVEGVKYGFIDEVIVVIDGLIYFIDVLLKYNFSVWWYDVLELKLYG